MGQEFDFRKYIEKKYRGRLVRNVEDKRDITVETISDLTLEDLDLEDQKLCINPDIKWGWGVCNGPSLEKSTHIAGYLFRPTQRLLWTCKKPYPYYEGAYGSGKSIVLDLKAVSLCFQYPGTRVALIRDTYPNLRRTVLKTLSKIFIKFGWSEGVQYRHHKTDNAFIFTVGDRESELLYMAAKNEGVTLEEAIKDFGSLEVDWCGIEEARDIDETIYLAIHNRIGRWGVIDNKEHKQLMLVGNPADEEHYLYKRYRLGLTGAGKKITNREDYYYKTSSTYDNRRNLSAQYIKSLENMDEYFKNTYLHGMSGYHPPDGASVYPQFKYEYYVSEDKLDHIPGGMILRGWDIGPTGVYKACVVGQKDKDGVLRVLKEFVSKEPGIERFGRIVADECKILYPKCDAYFDVGDPAAFAGTQMDTMQSPAKILMKEFGIAMIEGVKAFGPRKDAVATMLNHNLIIFDRYGCSSLIKGFQGGYYYKKQDEQQGKYGTTPMKNKFSHGQDALQYLCSRITYMKTDNKEKMMGVIKRKNRGLYQRVGPNRTVIGPKR